nr:uncharacterized protein LOC111425783 isoform X1 [Onthophagus taurus]
MIRFKCNPVICCTAIAIWTIIQTGLHLYAIIYIMWFTDCSVVENTNNNVLYLTYFFTRRCENETMHNLETRNMVVTIFNEPMNNNEPDISDILNSMILIYMILDCLWIVSSVALLTATLLNIKELWGLFFYLPWIIIATIVLIFDTFCSIFFGLQIPNDGNLFDWLNLIGFGVNISENMKKLEGDVSTLASGAASIIMTFVASRGVIVWIINLVTIIYIIKITIKISKKKPPDQPSSQRIRHSQRFASFTTEERIKKWYQFYESEDSQQTTSESTTSTSTRSTSNNRLEAAEEDAGCSKVSGNSINQGGNQISLKFISKSVLSPDSIKRIEKLNLGELRGQLPWSYFSTESRDINPESTYVKLSNVDEGVSKL